MKVTGSAIGMALCPPDNLHRITGSESKRRFAEEGAKAVEYVGEGLVRDSEKGITKGL